MFTVDAAAATQGPQTITLDGRLFTSLTSDTALLDPSVVIDVKIYNAAASCILYEEKQTVDTTSTDGRFTILVGSATGSSKRVTGEPGNTMPAIFQNATAIAGSCGVYTPTSGEARVIRLTIAPSTTGTVEVLSPDTVVDSVPNAMVAETLQGLDRDHVLAIDSTTTLSQTNVANVFSPTNYPILTSLLAGTDTGYVASGTNGAKIPTVTGVPSSLATGQIWFSSSANAFQYYNGSSVQTIGISGSGISALTVGSSFTAAGVSGGTLTTSGTIDLVNSGVTAGTYPKVTVNSKGLVTYGTGLAESDLPVVLTPGKVVGNAITSGTIGGSTAFYSSGNVTTTGNITGTNVSSNTDTTRAIRLFDPAAGSVNKITILAPTLTADYSLVLPATAGAAGYVLATDGSGNLSWASGSSGSVTSVGLALPSIFSVTTPLVTSTGTLTASLVSQNANLIFAGPASGAPAAPTFRGLAVADLPAGYDASLQKNSLAAGKIWIGSTAGVATAVTPFGDVNLSIAGSATVTQLQGSPISSIAPSIAGQVLRWDGAAWTPNFVAMTDLRSKVTGTAFFSNVCLANQTLTFNAVTDAMACSNIAIANTQVTWASTGANLVFAGPSTGGAAAPGFRTLTAADLPANGYDATYFKQGGNAFGASAVLGTSDAQPLTINTSNLARLTILASGNVGVGVISPTARLMLPAGTSVAGTSPLKLSAGPVTTAPEAGAVEFDGSALYYTDSGNVRHALAASGSGIAALTGDVTASGNGSVSSMVTKVNGIAYPSTAALNTIPVVTSAGTVTYEAIPNAALANNSTTLGATILTLGGTANSVTGLNSLGLGVNGVSSATLTLANGVTGGATTSILPSASTLTAWSFTLPAGPGSNGYFLSTNGSGVTSWSAPLGSGTVSAGSANQLAFYSTSGSAVNGLTSTANSVLLTNASNAPTWNLSASDNFSQYALLAGRTGGQVWFGGSGASENATISSTSNAIKGFVLLAPTGGNVGVGTLTPQAVLDVFGTGSASAMLVPRDSTTARPSGVNGMLRYNTTTSQLETYSSGAWNGVATSSLNGGASQWTTNGSALYYAGGNVGVGTNAPANKLESFGDGNWLASRAASAAGASTIGAQAFDYYSGPSYTASYLTINGSGVTGTTASIANAQLGLLDFQNTTNALIMTNGGSPIEFATTSIERMRIAAGGNIGIGTTAPSYALDINSASGAQLRVNAPTGQAHVVLAQAGTTNGDIFASGGAGTDLTVSAGRFLNLNAGGLPSLQLASAGVGIGGYAGINYSIPASGLVVSGSVGIGTSSPQALLDVNGSGATSAMLVPRDSTTARPAGINGMLRYNTSLNQLETYSSGAWGGLATSAGVSGAYLPLAGGTLTGTVAHPLGTVTAPSLNFGDATSGFYSTGTGNVSIATAGANRMTITSAGAVGIGTSSPTSSLHVSGAGAQNLTLAATDAAAGVSQAGIIYSTPSGLALTGMPAVSGRILNSAVAGELIFNNRAGGIVFSADTSYNRKDLYVSSAGYVGVGTASPQTGLNVVSGDYNYDPAIHSQLELQTTTAYNSSPTAGISFQVPYNSGGTTAGIGGITATKENATSGDVSSYLSLYTRSNGAAVAERLHINSAGNVGIGTATPGAILDVNGSGTSQSAMLVPRDSTTARPAGVNGMLRYNTTNAQLETYSSGAWAGLATSASVTSSASQWTTSGSNIFYSSGSVGIGTNAPTAPLSIALTSSNNNFVNVQNYSITDGGGSGRVDTIAFQGGATFSRGMQIVASETGGGFSTNQSIQFNLSSMALTNTGAYPIQFFTNNVERVRIDGSGNLGVGISSPAYLLDLNVQNTSSARFISNGATNGFIGMPYGNFVFGNNVYYNTGNFYLEKSAAAALIDVTAGDINFNTVPSGTAGSTVSPTGVMTVKNSGLVGIGTVTPQAGLDIYGVGTAASAILVPRDTTGNRPAGVNGMLRYNTSLSQLETYSSGAWAGLGGAGSSGISGSGTTNYLPKFSSASALTNSLIFDDGSHIGIGTTSTSARMQVITNNLGDGIVVTGNNGPLNSVSNGFYTLDFGLATSGGYFSNIALAGDAVIRTQNAGSNGSLILSTQNATGSIKFASGTTNSNDTTKMTLTNGGSLGIGTSSPGAILDVYGVGTSASAILVPRDTTGNRPAGVNGMLRYNTSLSQLETYSNGAWAGLATGSSGATAGALSALTAATATNTIDNTSYAQTWNWSGLSTQTALSSNANALTTGTMLNLATSNNSVNSTNGLLNVANTGTSTSGLLARFQSNSSASSGLTINTNNRVGINTTNPSSTLDVNGLVIAEQRILSIGGSYQYPDYAFGSSGNGMGMFYAGANLLGFSTNSVERMRIDASGNVGIGTSTPGAIVDAIGTIRGEAQVAALQAYNSGTGQTSISFTRAGAGTDAKTWEMIHYASGDFSLRAVNDAYSSAGEALHVVRSGATISQTYFPTGNVGIGTATPGYPLQVYGDLALSGNIRALGGFASAGSSTLCGSNGGAAGYIGYCSSDRRLKKDIHYLIEDELDKVLNLKPVTFRWKNSPDRQIAGFIAQDVQEQIPEAVYEVPKSPYLGFDSNAVLSYVVKAFQEFFHRYESDSKAQSARIESQDLRIKKLENENQELREALCAQNSTLSFCSSKR